MKNHWKTHSVIGFCAIMILACSINPQATEDLEIEPDYSIRLQCYHHSRLPTKAYIEDGLRWISSYLGADLHQGQIDSAIVWESADSVQNKILLLHVDRLGFNNDALKAMLPLLEGLRSSASYQSKGTADIGRFVAHVFLNPEHYYAITAPAESLQKLRKTYPLIQSPILELGPGQSTVALGHRRIFGTFADTLDFTKNAFLAKEGHINPTTQSFEVDEFEVIDFMTNGQPRFAIYNSEGKLITGVSKQRSLAGKPSKCAWCHESKVAPNFAAMNIPKVAEFNKTVQNIRKRMAMLRSQLDHDLAYDNKGQHTTGEMLYLTFMDPTAERLAQEWNLSTEATLQLLRDEKPHKHPEFGDLGMVYKRHLVDKYNPVKVLSVVKEARESDL